MKSINIKRAILEFLSDQSKTWQRSPPLLEVRQMFSGVTRHVDLHLRQLVHEGLIALGGADCDPVTLVPFFADAFPLKRRSSPASHITLHNDAVVMNLRTATDPDRLEFCYLEVTDASMADEGILPTDVAILINRPPVRGDIVAVTINGQTVLRRFLVIADIPHVLAENVQRPDLRPAWDLPISGVLRAVTRLAPLNPNLPPPSHTKVCYDDDLVNTGTPNSLKTSAIVSKRGWPESPSGVMLNDTRKVNYGSLDRGKRGAKRVLRPSKPLSRPH